MNGPDENGNYSFSMPDYDITLTAKWTQKDVIDPDVDLKFDAVTGEVTSNNTQVNADDIINRKFYDDKGNEVPGEKLMTAGSLRNRAIISSKLMSKRPKIPLPRIKSLAIRLSGVTMFPRKKKRSPTLYPFLAVLQK